MKRKLLRQMANEWRSNIWLCIELMIVSSVIWYIAEYLYTERESMNQYIGVDIDNVYKVTWGFNQPYDTTRSHGADMSALLDKLRRDPDIEAAGITNGLVPYNYNFWGEGVTVEYRGHKVGAGGGNKLASEGMLDVFRIRSSSGQDSHELEQLLLEPHTILVADNFPDWGQEDFDSITGRTTVGADLVGSQLYYQPGAETYRVVGTYQPLKRNDREWPLPTMIRLMRAGDDLYGSMYDLVIRVHPEARRDFRHNFRSRINSFETGNLYLIDVESMDDIRRVGQADDTAYQRNMLVTMLFLLVSIFLGLLGTFWFRTQQRVGEIAIRKAAGATDAQILRRSISESLLLLTAATIPAIGIDLLLAHFELTIVYWHAGIEPTRFAINAALTYAVMALMVVLGILFPSLRAMRIEPALALHAD